MSDNAGDRITYTGGERGRHRPGRAQTMTVNPAALEAGQHITYQRHGLTHMFCEPRGSFDQAVLTDNGLS